MSDMSAAPARPVSLFTIVFLFVVFAAFWFAVRYFYQPSSTAPANAVAENLPEDMKWRASADSRRAALQELRNDQAKKLTDPSAGFVQIPIDRAMELTAQQYGAKK